MKTLLSLFHLLVIREKHFFDMKLDSYVEKSQFYAKMQYESEHYKVNS